MSLLDNIKNFILRKVIVKEEKYLTPLSARTMEDVAKVVDKKRELENAQLKATVLKQKRDIEMQKQEKVQIQEDEALKREVFRKKDEREELEKFRALKLRVIGLEKKPTFFLRSNVPWNEFMGIYLKETSEGHLLFYPWLKNRKGQDIIFKKPAMNFGEFFKEPVGIVSQLRGGKLDSNFDISANNKPLLYRNDIKETGENEKVRVIDIELQKEREYEETIQELTYKIGSMAQIVKDLKKKEIDYSVRMADDEIISATSVKERDVWASKFAVLAEKSLAYIKELGSIITSYQDLSTKHVLTERMNWVFNNVLGTYQNLLEEKLPKEQAELMEDKIMKNLSNLIDFSNKLPTKETVKRIPAPKPKEETK